MIIQNIHGMLLLDKPSGISSNQVLQKIKHMFCIKKAGYVGTLDPLATGLLPIFFGESTKISEYFSNSKKKYYTVAKLGETTTTYDSEGIVLKSRKVNFSKLELLKVLHILRYKNTQVIPSYSAVKYKGRPLYTYARRNVSVPKMIRSIQINQLNCIKYNNQFIKLEIVCSKGTYIRSIINDLGELLGCGAHIVELRRLKVHNYSIMHAITFKHLNYLFQKYYKNAYFYKFYEYLIPFKQLFFQLPEVICTNNIIIKHIKNINYFFNINISQIFRITFYHKSTIFVIGRIDQTGKCISCRLLNIS
ncbi:tRNA pseudouridine(55) synthase TruB [Buchnera aphidicola]|uniref:tRNA pseudouridine synthase B n=1 Tax=Buchnera aphidicola (Sarucallis kahawaluokalani) TaxID=1241878 RepID=A0A4D6YA45_9GAMM|nr:tRNA pseudouridine(55) synthase TruB [Buchnera aphidicola]QCI26042.1 tRNA pseudouridine(55) synthase TruB [Buchnera aphidicola (Sarucallis kahawaluokalani)]